MRPADDLAGWGYELPDRWGVLATADGDEPVPSEQGRHHDLYTAFAAAIRGEGPQPVPATEGVRTLAVLDAARVSAEQRCSVEVHTRVTTSALHATSH